MILRKPYAILIKNFKLIHAILAILMGYLFYKTNMILSFLNEYLSSVATTITNEVTSSLFGPLVVITLILIILGSIVILALMRFKDKPIKFYIYNILIHIALAIFYYFAFYTVKSLEVGLVDVRVLKIIHDLCVVALIIQVTGLILVVIRATGFDIKSFNFKKDLEELNITSTDNEEFELDVEVDTDKLRRLFRKKIRHFRYAYLENKLLFNILFVIVSAIICIVIYLNVGVYNKTFKLNEAFKTNQFIFNFTDSYLTKYDYDKKEIKKDYQLVTIRLNIRTLYNQDRTLKSSQFYLDVDGRKFYHTVQYKDALFDLGASYINQIITNEFSPYLLVFEVPTSLSSKKMILKYYDTDNKIIKINVTPTNLDKEKKVNEANITEVLSLEESPLKNTSFSISSYELSPSFKLNYNYCVNQNCFDSVEYLRPGTNSNSNMVLMKLSTSFTSEDKISKIKNVYDLISIFGSIQYKINGETKTMKNRLVEVTPKRAITGDIYLEVTSELMNADEIDILLNIRNKIYTYHLK